MKKTSTKLKFTSRTIRLLQDTDLQSARGGAIVAPTEGRDCTETCKTNPWPYPP